MTTKHRAQKALDGIHAEMAKLEARKVELKHVISTIEYIFGARETAGKGKREMSAESREKIAEAQRERWRKAKRVERKGNKKADHHANNSSQPGWKGKDDSVIVAALKSKNEPQDAPEFARSLRKKLPHRTEGAIRQRLDRLAEAGVLKTHMNGKGEHGGVPHKMVEAA